MRGEIYVDTILKNAYDIQDEIISWRRHLHMNPELSFQEYETSEFVKKNLEKMGLDVEGPIAKTGLVVNIKGKKEGPTVGLRADMDALPIKDEKEVPYKSKKDNVAHLCGHDAHTAILLGVAKTLANFNLERGNIKL